MPDPPEIFTRTEVTSRGFEASCIDAAGVRYLWHLDHGLRVDALNGSTMLVIDPAALPEGPWRATELGEEELRDPTLLVDARPSL